MQPVQFSDWAAPIVPVVKQDGSVRICGDSRLTVNRVSKLDSYPLPRVENLFAAMAGGKQYAKLDLQHAYQQLVLDDDSKPYTVINTHRGSSNTTDCLLECHLLQVYSRARERWTAFFKEYPT